MGEFPWLTVVWPEAPDGVELPLEPDSQEPGDLGTVGRETTTV